MSDTLLFANDATSFLTTGVAILDTSVTVPAGEGARFPVMVAGQVFTGVLEDLRTGAKEYVRATARMGDVINITRGQEGSAPQAFPPGSTFSLRLTAAALDAIMEAAESADTGLTDAPNDTLMYGRRSLAWARAVAVGGDTMIGPLFLPPAAPTAPAEASHKGYVDARTTYTKPFAGAIARTFVQRAADVELHVKDFGAVGDGVTDDSAAINAAWAALDAKGGVLKFGPNHYRINSPLVKPTFGRAITFRGEGKASFNDVPEGTRLIWGGSTTANWIVVQGADNTRFENMEFAPAAGVVPTAGYAIHMTNPGPPTSAEGLRSVFQDCRIYGAWRCLFMNVPDVKIDGCNFTADGDICVHVYGGAASRVDMLRTEDSNFICNNLTGTPMLVEGQVYSVWNERTYFRGGFHGCHAREAEGFQPGQVRQHRCASEVNAGTGLYMESIGYGVFEGSNYSVADEYGVRIGPNCKGTLTFVGCATGVNRLDGFRCEATEAIVIVIGHTSNNNSVGSDNVHHNMLFDAGCKNFIVMGCRLGGDNWANPAPARNSRNGLTITSGCTGYIVIGNNVLGNDNVGIFDGGSGGQVSGNIGYRSSDRGQVAGATPDINGDVIIPNISEALPSWADVKVTGAAAQNTRAAVHVLALGSITARLYNTATNAPVTSGSYNLIWAVVGSRSAG